jgi:hypothetical protein
MFPKTLIQLIVYVKYVITFTPDGYKLIKPSNIMSESKAVERNSDNSKDAMSYTTGLYVAMLTASPTDPNTNKA